MIITLSCSINTVFVLQTSHTSDYSHLVIVNFLKRFNDFEISIRQLFLQTALLLLTCSKDFIDMQLTRQICMSVCKICDHDPQIELRQFALSIIEQIFHNKPINVFYIETFEVLTRVCFDHVTSFRLYAQEKLVNIYLDLMKHYPKEIFYLSNVGKIIGALKVRFNEVKNKKEKEHLYNQLTEVNIFFKTNESIVQEI